MKTCKKILIAGVAIAVSMAGLPDAKAQTRIWGTYYGGDPGTGLADAWDSANAVVTTGSGFVYVVGRTESTNGIATGGAFDSVKAMQNVDSGYIAKFDSNGKLVWGTYYGDEVPAQGMTGLEAELIDVKIDAASNLYVVGHVRCPSTGLASPGAFQVQCSGESDVYMAKFDPAGKRLWGTYFGGSAEEQALAMVVTTSGVYITGMTRSTSGIAPQPSPDGSFGGKADGFIAKFDQSGKKIWSRYYGGTGFDRIYDIACRKDPVSAEDDCAIAGETDSSNDIATPGTHDNSVSTLDAFVARIKGSDGQRVWGSYFGSSSMDWAKSLVVDSSFNIYVGGSTSAKFGLVTPDAFQPTSWGETNNFLAKFDADGHLSSSTFFGEDEVGAENEVMELAIDGSGDVYALALVSLTDIPLIGEQATEGAFDNTFQGNEAVVTKFSQKTFSPVWATYYGGSGEELTELTGIGGITVGRDRHIYVVGDTSSPEGMATPGAHKSMNGQLDAFIVEFSH